MATMISRPGAQGVSAANREALVRNIGTIVDAPGARPVGDVLGFIRSAVQVTASEIQENKRLIDLIPEVNQAINKIVIPSIISPSDFRNDSLSYHNDDPKLSVERQQRIAKIVETHFEHELELSTNLPDWIRTSNYIAGAKVLVTIPLSSFQEVYNQSRIAAMESLDDAALESFTQDLARQSVYGIADVPLSDDRKAQYLTSMSAALESHVDVAFSSIMAAEEIPYDSAGRKQEKLSGIAQFCAEALESVSIIDNTDVVAASHVVEKKSQQKIATKTRERHSSSFFIAMPPQKEGATEVDHPLFLEPSADGIIPIISPSNPKDKIGYFMPIDEYGCPLDVANAMNGVNLPRIDPMARTDTIGALYKAHGFSDLKSSRAGSINHFDTMSGIYQEVIRSHLQGRLSNAGYKKIKIGENNAVYQAMFSRYLNHRSTRLVFLPPEMVTYFAYRYHDTGIGKTKLSEMKFVLSQRLCLIVARAISQYNNAIDRRRVNINFPDKFRGNVAEYMSNVRIALARKEAMGLTLDPTQAMENISLKGITVKPNNVPGAENFTVEHVESTRNSAPIDEQLFDDLRNQTITGLDVPPAALNALSEFEFMRSIAVMNIFFSRFIDGMQKITCKHVSAFIRKYVGFSGPLVAEIREVLREETDTSDTDDSERGIASDKKTTALDQRIAEVIGRIHVKLPSAAIAPTKAQFETLSEFAAAMDILVNGVYDEQMANDDPEAASALAAIRSMAKSQMIQQALTSFGLGSEFDIPTLASFNPGKIIAMRQTLANVKVALADLRKVVEGGDDGGEVPGAEFQDAGGEDDASATPGGPEAPGAKAPEGADETEFG